MNRSHSPTPVLPAGEDDVAGHTRSHDRGRGGGGEVLCTSGSSAEAAVARPELERESSRRGRRASGQGLLWGNIALLTAVLMLLLYAVSLHPWLSSLGAPAPAAVTPPLLVCSGDAALADLNRMRRVYLQRLAQHARLNAGFGGAAGALEANNRSVSEKSCERLVGSGNRCMARIVHSGGDNVLELLQAMRAGGTAATAETDLLLSGLLLREVLTDCLGTPDVALSGNASDDIDANSDIDVVISDSHVGNAASSVVTVMEDVSSSEVLELVAECDNAAAVFGALLDQVGNGLGTIV
jgi:hypothetical protein